MPRLTTQERERAIGMLSAGLSCRHVANHLGCNVSTISRLQTRENATGSVADRPRSGRPRVTTEAQDRHIRLSHVRDRFRSAVDTARETRGVRQNRVSASTIRRRLRAADLHARVPYRGPILHNQARQNRLTWARQHQRWRLADWRRVLFSDESRICLDRPDRRRRVWRRRGERYADACVREGNRWGGASVMIWGAVSTATRTPLVVIDGTLTSQRYIDTILRPVVLPHLRAHGDVTVFQQDNARPHSARLTRDFLDGQQVDVMPWPAYSPDLSPIEHVWDILKTAVSRRRPAPQNRQQLIAAVQEEWERIPQHRITRLVQSMRRRCTACVRANGGHTRY